MSISFGFCSSNGKDNLNKGCRVEIKDAVEGLKDGEVSGAD